MKPPIPKRDFLFVDESGDPGDPTHRSSSSYYIQGLVHITNISLRRLNVHLGAMRYFGNISAELKSSRHTKEQKERLRSIIRSMNENGEFMQCSAIIVDKKKYEGLYLEDTTHHARNSNHFKNLMMRILLEFHFSHTDVQSEEIEIVIDRFQRNEHLEQSMRNYLREDKHHRLPRLSHIIQADSRYVELLQIADLVSGFVKEKFFSRTSDDFQDLFDFISVKEITK